MSRSRPISQAQQSQLSLEAQAAFCARLIEDLNQARKAEAAAEARAEARDAELARVYEENQRLRENNLALLDRVAVKLQMVPPSESLTREPAPNTSDETGGPRRADSVRRTGPVANERLRAQQAYDDGKNKPAPKKS